MSPTTRPAIVLVPGAHHVPRHYSRVIDSLRSDGYTVDAVTLPLPEDETIPAGFEGNLYVIRKAVENQLKLGSDVLLILHSASGTSGPAAIRGLTKEVGSSEPGVYRMLMISGILTLPGESIQDFLGGKTAYWLGPSPENDRMEVFPFDYAGEAPTEPGLCLCSPVKALYNDMTPEQQREAYDLLVPTHISAFAGTPDYAAWQDIPTTYVICEQDKTLFPSVQEKMIERTGAPMDIRRLNASHSPFVSMPEQVVDLIKEAAQKS